MDSRKEMYMKKIMLLMAAAISATVFTACSGADATPIVTDFAQFASDPQAFQVRRDVSLTGIVSNDGGFRIERHEFSFAVSDGASEMSLPINFRGSQALPQDGTEIKITGRIRENCCNVLYMRAVSYEVVQ